jgi:hypothetical protein
MGAAKRRYIRCGRGIRVGPIPQNITRREAPVDVVTTDESDWHDRIVVLDR